MLDVQPLSNSLQPYGQAVRLLCPWNSPGKNTGMGCHSLLQEISLIQGLNRLLHCRRILYHLSHQGSPNNGRALCAKSLLLCLTLCEPMNHSQAGHSCFQKEKKKKTWGPGYCLRAAHCSHCSLFSFKLGWASVGTTIPQREPRFQQAVAGGDDTPPSQLSLASISASSPQKPSQDCICRSKVSFFFFFPALGLHCCS